MKQLLFIASLLLSFSAFSQEVISEAIEIEVQEDSLYFLKTTSILDNSTNYPDTIIRRQLLGDSTAAVNYVFTQAVEDQQFLSARMAQAFLARQYRSEFNNYDELYDSIATDNLYQRLEDEYFNNYNARYRIQDVEADTTFFCTVVRVGADDRLRLEHEETGQRWAMLIRSRNNFQLNNFYGDTREFYYDRIQRSNGNRVYKSPAFVEGNHKFIITRLNQ